VIQIELYFLFRHGITILLSSHSVIRHGNYNPKRRTKRTTLSCRVGKRTKYNRPFTPKQKPADPQNNGKNLKFLTIFEFFDIFLLKLIIFILHPAGLVGRNSSVRVCCLTIEQRDTTLTILDIK